MSRGIERSVPDEAKSVSPSMWWKLEAVEKVGTATFELVDAQPDELDKVDQKLFEHTESVVGPTDFKRLDVHLRSNSRELAGGLSGFTLFGWLHIQAFWISTEFRGQGFGHAMLERAEREALRRGCHSAWLYTTTWQAPAFYQKRGYQPVAVLDNYPGEHEVLFLRKSLSNSREAVQNPTEAAGLGEPDSSLGSGR